MTDEQATVKRAARLLRARELVAQGHFRACETTELQIISENDTSKGNTLTPASGPEFPGRGRGNNWKARGGRSSRGSENRNRTSLPRIPRPHTSEQPVRSRQQVSVGSVAASRKVWQPKSARALDMVSSASKGPISAEVDVPVMVFAGEDDVERPTLPIHRISAYDALGELGKGQFGIVSQAVRCKRGGAKEVVAIKMLKFDFLKEGFPLEALREITLLSSLRHPNIVRMHAVACGSGEAPE